MSAPNVMITSSDINTLAGNQTSNHISGNLTVDGTITAGSLVGDCSGSATSAATVTNAAQPAITSVGSLTGLTMNGLLALNSYAKASLPSATAAGELIYVSDATGAHVTGSLCFSTTTGTSHWIDVTTGVAVV